MAKLNILSTGQLIFRLTVLFSCNETERTDNMNNKDFIQEVKGKREDLSLKEKKRIIQRDLFDGIDTKESKMTLCQLYARKNAQRRT